MSLLLALLFACASDEEASPASAASPATATAAAADVCCEAGDPGEARWEACADQTVLEHVCKRAEICCTVQWAEPCASGYSRFAATCASVAADAAATGDGAGSASGPDGPEQATADRLAAVEVGDRVKVKLVVDMEPAPDASGGHVFYGGFLEVDERVGMPVRDSRPSDYGAVERWVQELPVEAELDLVDGLHYFVMYGFGDHPQPGDRMAPLQQVQGAGELRFTIRDRTIPKEGETPSGGYPPGEAPGAASNVDGEREEPPPL
ncbi:MAG: hypothetical protein VX265_09840 [Myxococcota bacterium]|nr:hypothetical protein [Myxococcota bacterium]